MAALAGTRIVITGVSRGVGRETARLFLEEGAEIVGVGRDAARLERVARELDPTGRRLTVVAADVAAPPTAPRIAEAVGARWGALDVLFNNAGVQIDGQARGPTELTDKLLGDALAVNFWAPLRLTVALLPLLRLGKQPRIINVSSGAGNFESMRMSGLPSYRLSKWALNGLTMQLAAELRGKVSVNAFDPGWVKTDMGGPGAPGSPEESARGALAVVTMPFAISGKFWKDGQEIPF